MGAAPVAEGSMVGAAPMRLAGIPGAGGGGIDAGGGKAEPPTGAIKGAEVPGKPACVGNMVLSSTGMGAPREAPVPAGTGNGPVGVGTGAYCENASPLAASSKNAAMAVDLPGTA